MKELSELIKITPMESAIGSEFTVRALRPFEIEPAQVTGDNGVFYRTQKKVEVEQPEKHDFPLGHFRGFIEFRSTSGNIYTLGSRQFPAVIGIYPQLNHLSLSIDHAADFPPFMVPEVL